MVFFKRFKGTTFDASSLHVDIQEHATHSSDVATEGRWGGGGGGTHNYIHCNLFSNLAPLHPSYLKIASYITSQYRLYTFQEMISRKK